MTRTRRLACIVLVCWLTGLAAIASASESALDRLRRLAPAVAAGLDPVSRAVLARIRAEQLQALHDGSSSARELQLGDGRTLAEFVEALFGGGGLAVPFASIDAGGGHSSFGELALLGSIGQPDAHVAENVAAGLLLVGGFRGRGALSPDLLFSDGFETGDHDRWSAHTFVP